LQDLKNQFSLFCFHAQDITKLRHVMPRNLISFSWSRWWELTNQTEKKLLQNVLLSMPGAINWRFSIPGIESDVYLGCNLLRRKIQVSGKLKIYVALEEL